MNEAYNKIVVSAVIMITLLGGSADNYP